MPSPAALAPCPDAFHHGRSCLGWPPTRLKHRWAMEHPGFFQRAMPIPLSALAAKIGADLAPDADGSTLIDDVKPLGEAACGTLSFLDNRKYLPQLAATRASACLVAPVFRARVPSHTAALVTAAPYRAFALALQHFYPDALRSKTALAVAGEPPVHASAALGGG